MKKTILRAAICLSAYCLLRLLPFCITNMIYYFSGRNVWEKCFEFYKWYAVFSEILGVLAIAFTALFFIKLYNKQK